MLVDANASEMHLQKNLPSSGIWFKKMEVTQEAPASRSGALLRLELDDQLPPRLP
jgi:hypothetical protein